MASACGKGEIPLWHKRLGRFRKVFWVRTGRETSAWAMWENAVAKLLLSLGFATA
jgi:hypothetical protein